MKESVLLNEVRAEGRLQKNRQNIVQILQTRFGMEIPPEVVTRLNLLNDETRLDTLVVNAVNVDSIETFMSLL